MKVKVNTSSVPRVVHVDGVQTQVISAGIQGPPGATGFTTISDAQDVDSTNLENGSVLVYFTDTAKWTSTTLLSQQTVEAGEY